MKSNTFASCSLAEKKLLSASITVLMTFAFSSLAWAQHAVLDADSIVSKLLPPDSGPTGRSLLGSKAITFHVSPDAASRSCEKEGATGTGLVGRNLYVTNAPTVDLTIAFEFDKSRLRSDATNQLDQLAKALNSDALKGERFVVAGHTDAVGRVDYNDKLSCDRAIVVRNYLRDRHGVAADRLAIYGFGPSKLKDSAQPQSEINRRTEIRLIPRDQ